MEPLPAARLAERQTEVTRAYARCVCLGLRSDDRIALQLTMTTFTSVTPSLLVRDIARSTSFYRDVLGFDIKQTVPDRAPFVFVWLERDGVPLFLNDPKAVAKDFPDAPDRAPGGTATLFFIISDVDGFHQRVGPKAKVIMPLTTQFYGMREFAVEDPDGHILTFAARVEGD